MLGNQSPPSLEEEGSDSESDSEDDISEDDRQDPTYSPDEGDTDSSGEDSADEYVLVVYCVSTIIGCINFTSVSVLFQKKSICYLTVMHLFHLEF